MRYLTRAIRCFVRQTGLSALPIVVPFILATPWATPAQPCIETATFFGDRCADGDTVKSGMQGGGSDFFFFVDTTLCGATNAFDLGEGNPWTGQATPGPDLQVTGWVGDRLWPCMIFAVLTYCDGSTPFDGSLFLVEECSNGDSTVMGASDRDGVGELETISFHAPEAPLDSTFTFIVDSRDDLCGRFLLQFGTSCIGEEDATAKKTWGTLKKLFR